MCTTCGCGVDDAAPRLTLLAPHDHPHTHDHSNPHRHQHDQPHDHEDPYEHTNPDEYPQGRPVGRTAHRLRVLEIDLLAKNDAIAAGNRAWLGEHDVRAVNLMSSPGSGKTTLLVRTLTDLAGTVPVAVVEGDQETALDAERIHATGAPVLQVNTGAACHLDAEMMRAALDRLAVRDHTLLFVENVGNLVCPAMFDLGESAKAVVISVTEGDDKPLKYPQMFAAADLVLVNKIDLLPYVDFDVDRCIANARRVNPGVQSLSVSATEGTGLDSWYAWLRDAAAGPVVDPA